MTRVSFFDGGGRITGFRCQGHSGFSAAGTDIVCAAVTALIRMTECTLNDVCGSGAQVQVDQDAAAISLRLPAQYSEEDTVQAVLAGLMLTLSSLRDEYPDHLEVLELQNNA